MLGFGERRRGISFLVLVFMVGRRGRDRLWFRPI